MFKERMGSSPSHKPGTPQDGGLRSIGTLDKGEAQSCHQNRSLSCASDHAKGFTARSSPSPPVSPHGSTSIPIYKWGN